MADALFILGPGHPIEAVLALTEVRQRYGDRVLVVSAERTAMLTPFGRVFAPGQRAPEGDDLSTTEALGVGAWNLRVDMPDKARRGDGLAWDSEGFDAP